ncbi:MAG: hypothetical protein K0S08_2150 [Gammaproteobacteria bacterium]|jgi:hypothetical protein|nr:hypothetical protein [Gammaproteobacteria bacterium]
MSFKKICGLSFLLTMGTFGFVESALATPADQFSDVDILIDGGTAAGDVVAGDYQFPNATIDEAGVFGVWRDGGGSAIGVTNTDEYEDEESPPPGATGGLTAAAPAPQESRLVFRKDGDFSNWFLETSYARKALNVGSGKVILASKLGVHSGKVSRVPQGAIIAVLTVPALVREGRRYGEFNYPNPEVCGKARGEFLGVGLKPRRVGQTLLVPISELQAKFQ